MLARKYLSNIRLMKKFFSMKTRLKLLLVLSAVATISSISSCNDKNDEYDDKGSSSVLSITAPDQVYMGDSISFTYNVSASGADLNQTKLQLYMDDQLESERIMNTPADGEYTGKLAIPFIQNVDDRDITIKVRAQNDRFANASAEKTIKIVRPVYSKLILRDINGNEYDMLPVEGKPYTYSVTSLFPSELYATIIAPAYGNNGNEQVFGNADGKIIDGSSDNINFSADAEGTYQVTFNTKTFEGTPFVKFAVNGDEFSKIDDNNFKVDRQFKQNEEIEITGLKADYSNYWINPTYFDVVAGSDGKKLRWRGVDGKYRVVCDKLLKYFRICPLNAQGDDLADYRNGDKVVWVIGSGGIGQPNFANNPSGWSPKESNGITMCQIKDNVYQLILKAGSNAKCQLNPYDIAFKFFYQCGWGSSWGSEGPGASPTITDGSAWFKVVSAGDLNAGTKSLISGRYYVLTLDLTGGDSKPKLTVVEEKTIPEVE